MKSARFTVYSNASVQGASAAARQLERLADVLEATSEGLRTDGGREVRVYLFKDLDSFKPYRPTGDDENGITAGFHVTGPDVELIAYHRPAEGDVMTFACHEYLHAVLSRSLGSLPVWVNEGLAEYYSTFAARRKQADIGQPIPEHIAWLRERGLLPLRQLLTLTPESREYNEGARRGTIYAESWALVHMLLMADPIKEDRFGTLVQALSRGESGESALKSSYGPGALDSLAGALEAYTRRSALAYTTYKFQDEFADVAVHTRDLSPAEALAALGELLLRSREGIPPLARAHLAAAWDADSTLALTAGLQCEVAARSEDDAAFDRWAGALERAAHPDPRAAAIAGGALATRPFRRGWSPSWPARGADAVALRARRLLERANEARPGIAEWLIPYGLTFLDDSTGLALGVSALMTAREAAPRRAEATGALAVLQAREGARGNALYLYGSMKAVTGTDAVWRYWAGYAIARRTLDDAFARFEAGDVAEAETLLTHLPVDVPETGVPHMADRMLGWMHAHGAGRQGERPEIDAGETASADGGTAGGSGGQSTGSNGATRSNPFHAGAIGDDSPVGRAIRAAAAGDYATAERLIDDVKKHASGGSWPELDTLADRVRNMRRLESARALIRGGDLAGACALWEQVLANHPVADVRAYALKQRERYCAGKPKPATMPAPASRGVKK